MTNFDFLRSEGRFSAFSGAAAAAEKIFPIDTAACVVNVRRAAELTVKWMFENDKKLTLPKRDSLAALISASSFRAAVGQELTEKMEFVRRVGNNAAHNPESVTKEQAALSLRYLFDFENYVAKRYGATPSPYPFDTSLLSTEEEIVTEAMDAERIAELIRENRSLKRMLRAGTASDETVPPEDTPAPTLSEADTRRMYIEADLAYAGWRIGVDCLSEYRIDELPAGSGVGYADYVLFDGKTPLAVIETRAAGEDPALGRQQAKLYADALEKKHGHRPLLFLTSGADTRLWQDDCETERRVAGIFSKSDLRRLKRMRKLREKSATASLPTDTLTDRPYQKNAVRAVCKAFLEDGRRSATLSMAPATGKTRTALAAVDVLYRAGVAQSILYLTESDILAHQALRASDETLSLPCASISEEKRLASAAVLVATYDDLLADADELYDAHGAHLLTPGRFDLILCDEADSRITEKYREIFDTFDARLLFLSSTPDAQDAVFTYTHAQAVADGYIAPMQASALRIDALENGITLARMDDSVKKAFGEVFRKRGLPSPRRIAPAEMFTKYFNDDTVRLLFETLCRHGVCENGLPAKTIIFTESHYHSEMLYELWGKLYPKAPPHFCRVIDLATNYAESLLHDFADGEKMPRIALSHDILKDGVDIPDVKNLVFFTKAASRAQFWRMLGRGMRLWKDKTHFFVLDLCDNFRTYGADAADTPVTRLSNSAQTFCLRVQLTQALQSLEHAASCEQLRRDTVREIVCALRTVNRDSFAARHRAALLDRYKAASAFAALSPADTAEICDCLAPLLPPAKDAPATLSLDLRMLTLMLARANHRTDEVLNDTLESLRADVEILAKRASHKKIAQQKKLLNRILRNAYLENASLTELEEARRVLRTLVRYLPKDETPIRFSLPDRIIGIEPIKPV